MDAFPPLRGDRNGLWDRFLGLQNMLRLRYTSQALKADLIGSVGVTRDSVTDL